MCNRGLFEIRRAITECLSSSRHLACIICFESVCREGNVGRPGARSSIVLNVTILTIEKMAS